MSRDEIALQLLPGLHRDFQECVRLGECDCPSDWRRQIVRDAYKLADAFLIERAMQPSYGREKPPTTEFVK